MKAKRKLKIIIIILDLQTKHGVEQKKKQKGTQYENKTYISVDNKRYRNCQLWGGGGRIQKGLALPLLSLRCLKQEASWQ
jgi:hypothetical protein